jgi:hypothetical protein
VETTGAHTMKSSAPAKSATSTTAGKCVIRNETDSQQDGCREADQTVTNYHGRPPKPFGVPRIRWRSAANGDSTQPSILNARHHSHLDVDQSTSLLRGRTGYTSTNNACIFDPDQRLDWRTVL